MKHAAISAKTDIYWQRVRDFETRAKVSAEPAAGLVYGELAAGYRRLIEHLDQSRQRTQAANPTT
jgi:hypothetical protein